MFTIYLLAFLPFSVLIWRVWRIDHSEFKKIPGPETILARRPQRQLKQWAKEYGELFQVRLNAKTHVYVNSVEAARFIFDKQAIKTSSKAPLPVVFNLVSGCLRFFLMPKGHPWRTLRTVIQSQLTPIRSDTYIPHQEHEAKRLVFDLMTDNENNGKFFDHVKRYTMTGMMRTTYGVGVQSKVWSPMIHRCHTLSALTRNREQDDHQLSEIYQILQDFSEATFTKPYLADSLQLLNLLPSCLQWWRKSALGQLNRQRKLWLKLWADLERRIDQQQAQACLAKRWIEVDQVSQNGRQISREQWAFFAGSEFHGIHVDNTLFRG